MGADKTLKACDNANMSSTACITLLIIPTDCDNANMSSTACITLLIIPTELF